MGQIFLPGTPGSSVNRKKLLEADFKNMRCVTSQKAVKFSQELRLLSDDWDIKGVKQVHKHRPEVITKFHFYCFYTSFLLFWTCPCLSCLVIFVLQFTVLHESEYPHCSLLWACHRSVRATWQSSKPHHRTFFSVTFLLLFPLCLVLKKSKQQRAKNVGFFFLLMLLHSLFWIFSFSRTLRDYQSTTENNFFSNKIGPDPNSLALKKRLLVNSMDFEWRINPSVLRLRNSGQLW